MQQQQERPRHQTRHQTRQLPDAIADDDTTPRTPEEREWITILLRGVRKLRAEGIELDHEWIQIRRPPRSAISDFKVELELLHFKR